MATLAPWVLRPVPVTSWIARILLALVILFWTWFSIASGISEVGNLGFMALLMHLVLPVVLIALLVVCWRWELAGGLLLIAAAIAMAWFFGHFWKFQETLWILEVPVALMGVLLIISFFKTPRR